MRDDGDAREYERRWRLAQGTAFELAFRYVMLGCVLGAAGSYYATRELVFVIAWGSGVAFLLGGAQIVFACYAGHKVWEVRTLGSTWRNYYREPPVPRDGPRS